MADIVYINSSNANGAKVLSAIRQIKSGLGDLWELDGARLNAISNGTAVMAARLGTGDTAQAQMLSDRLGAVIGFILGTQTWMEDEAQVRQAILDLLDATQVAP